MDGDELKRKVHRWAQTVEYRYAWLALVNGGIAGSTAERLIKGNYVSTPKGKTVDILKRVLAKEREAQAS